MSKATTKKTKFKIQRRYGEELPGLGKEGALAKRNYPPGHTGQNRRRVTEFGNRLYEKQKVMYHYALREQQLRRFVKLAKKGDAKNWVERLFTLLESRLDNIVFRLGFAPSIAAARQMVSHKNVLVNDKILNIPSAIVRPNDEIKLTDKMYKLDIYIKTKEKPRLDLPSFLEKRSEKNTDIGKLLNEPTGQNVPFTLEKRYIAEFYAKVKA